MKINFIKKLDKVNQQKVLGLLLSIEMLMSKDCGTKSFNELDKAIKKIISFVY